MMQIELCEKPIVLQANGAPPERPSWRCEEVCRRAAGNLAADVLEWSGESSDRLPNITKHLAKILQYYGPDGFDLAKQMESNGYDADAHLVEILDNADCLLSNAYNEVVAEWIALYGIKSDFAVGDVVEFDHQGRIATRKKVTGVVYQIDEAHGRLFIRSDELGHVAPGQMGTQGVILDYEKVVKTTEQAL